MKIKKQSDIKDCGLVILQSLHHYYFDNWIEINYLKQKINYGKKGINLTNLFILGKKLGLIMDGFETNFKTLIENASKDWLITTVINEGENHYIIIKIRKRFVEIADPIKGNYEISIKKFEKIFSGLIVTIAKGEYKKIDIDLSSPFKYLSKNAGIVIWIFISIVLGVVLNFTTSIFMKLILDKILPGYLSNMLVIVCLGFIWIAILRALNSFLKKYMTKKLSTKIEWALVNNYFFKVRNASLINLNKLNSSDHLRRISLISSISQFISNAIFVIFNEIITFLIATSLLIVISPTLFGITLGIGSMIALITIVFQLFIKDKYEPIIKSQLDFFNSSIDKIMSFYELKEEKVKNFFTIKHKFYYQKLKQKDFKIWLITSWQGLLSELIVLISSILLTWISVNYVMTNKLTIGSMIMFIAIFHSFISPIEDLCSLAIALPQEQKHINLLSFVLNFEDEKLNKKGVELDKIKSIEFNNFSFGYDAPMFKIDYYLINKNLHITGENGSGKSTLLHIIANRYQGKGDLKYNNLEKNFLNLENLRNFIYISYPMSYIPNVSIYEFITLNQKTSMNLFNENIKNYNLNKLMQNLNLSFDQKIINNGENLSSGQRQLIMIMRLFSFKYKIIIIDEGLENIDLKKVHWLSKAINQFQDAIYIEVSHSKKYISQGKEVEIEKIIKYF